MTHNQLIGTAKAGEILGYSGDYMRELCGDKDKNKILEAQKVGKIWLFRECHIKKIKNTGVLKVRKKRQNKKKKKN